MTDHLDEISPFVPIDIKHKRIDKYKPEFLGRGGMQIVYGTKEFPNKVIKVDPRDVLLSIKHEQFSYNDTVGDQETAKEQNNRFAKLVEFFGKKHTLEQTSTVMKVPINQRVVNQMRTFYGSNLALPNDIEKFTGNEVWSVVVVQEKSDLFDFEPTKKSLASGYSESRPDITNSFKEAYAKVTAASVLNLSSENTISPDELSIVQRYLEAILQEAETDANLKSEISDFIKNAIGYSNTTGEILDVVGVDNIIFFKDKNGNWNYKLLDAIFESNGHQMITEAGDAVSKLSRNEKLSSTEVIVLKNTLNYARTINSLASLLGIEERIDFVPADAKKIDPITLFDALRA